MPIRKVVLYKHGLASYERRGSVGDSNAVELLFEEEEMNDVLKSLTISELSGKGAVTSVSYDNNKPTAQRLAEASVQLADSQVLGSVLESIRGCTVTLLPLKLTGRVMGVTNASSTTDEEGKRTTRQGPEVCLYCNGGSVRSVPLSWVENFVLEDKGVATDLSSVLDIHRSSGKKGDKKLTIFVSGSGPRELSVSYTVEAPIWKVSYRIVLPEPSATTPDKDSTDARSGVRDCRLQAWAIIDNCTSTPWEDVNLTLMAGQPHRHDVDLFTPRYKSSPVPQPAAGIRHPHAPRHMMQQQLAPPQQQQLQQQIPNLLNNAVHLTNYIQPTNDAQPASSPAPKAQTDDLGELFKYEISLPVTVKSNQSALVPIADEVCPGERVLRFDSTKHNLYPCCAVAFTNTTVLTLEGGPVVVLEGSGTYMGEAQLETMKPKQVRFLEFCTERAVEVWSSQTVETYTKAAWIEHGSLAEELEVLHRTTYKIRSKLSRPSVLYLEHRFRKDCQLVSSEQPTNPKPINNYISRTSTVANDTVEFVVEEARASSKTTALSVVSAAVLDQWVNAGYLDESTAVALAELVQNKTDIAAKEEQLASLAKVAATVAEDQARLRANLSVLGKSEREVKLRKTYVEDLCNEEDRLREHHTLRRNLTTEVDRLRDQQVTITRTLAMKRRAVNATPQ